jgi:hypothetical protein
MVSNRSGPRQHIDTPSAVKIPATRKALLVMFAEFFILNMETVIADLKARIFDKVSVRAVPRYGVNGYFIIPLMFR